MLRFGDKLNLSLVNARDIEGNVFSFSTSFLEDVSKIEFPKNLAAIDVCEYQEGLLTGGAVIFSIYIGERGSIEDLMLEINNIVFGNNVEVPSIKSPICFQNIAGKRVVFAKLNQQDIVVKNIEQLKEVLDKLSTEFSLLCKSVKRLQTLAYFGKIVNRNYDNCAFDSYGLDNGGETLYCRVDEYEHDVLPTAVCDSHQFIEGLGPIERENVSMGSRILREKK